MLPIAFVGFFILNNSRAYLREDKPRGPKALIWNIAMIVSIAASFASIVYYLVSLV